MPDKRKDSEGRPLRNGETQPPDSMHKFQYTDSDGRRNTVYSRRLAETGGIKGDQRQRESLREKEKRILKDLDGYIKRQSAERIAVSDKRPCICDIKTENRGFYTGFISHEKLKDFIGARCLAIPQNP